ncbi:MAG: CusA/CzcA family heavy metal efflux RND transporter [Gemmatimonadota bacterium]|nr:MAG: CusA/CzcA family heavy metal efflux RND transporter [Gemmatimonadota bacterium]
MIHRVIQTSVRWRGLTVLAMVGILAAGVQIIRTMPVDAIPDLSDIQVIVFTEYPGQAPQVVEDQVTYPLVTALLAVPEAEVVRGQSMFGLSFVYVLFEEGTDLYWARSRVLEYLNSASAELPGGVRPQLGPDATGVGWVFQYALVGDGYSLDELRSLQDWRIRFELQSVPGVSEVASVGGFVRQYQVILDPARLLAFGVDANDVIRTIRTSNRDVGGRTIEIAGGDYMVRGLGYLRGVGDIAGLTIGLGRTGTPVRVRDVANVTIGPDMRLGLVERNGRGEAVGGVVIMRYGENALEVIDAVKERIEEVEAGLPPGVRIVTTYDRSALIQRATGTLTRTLVEESIIVALVCLVFLLHARSAVVAIAILPLGIVLTLAGIRVLGVNANIMSLGGIAIAIGAMIDAAIVMIENMHKHIERDPARSRWDVVIESTREVGPALFVSLLIITLSFAPLFALQAEEGRLFKPLALTKTLAMASAALLSITAVPVLMGLFIRGHIRPESENPISRFVIWIYRPVLNWALSHRRTVLLASFVVVGGTLWPLTRLGSEFMPPLDEGSLMYMPNSIPGISIAQQRRLLQRQDSILMTFPEVESVWGKAGRAGSATDPAPISMVETIVNLKDPKEWPERLSQEELIAKMDRDLRFTGLVNSWTMPIKNRTDMLSTGIRTTLGVKIFGPDLSIIQSVGAEIEELLAPVDGTASIFAERSFGGRYLDITPDREALSRYGLSVGDVQTVVATALGGHNVTSIVDGQERYPVQVRYAREFRDDPTRLRQVLVATPSGPQVPLTQLASVGFSAGPPVIKSENGQLVGMVFIDVRDRDVGSYVREARRLVDEQVALPAGYRLQWSGQYESIQRVKARLTVVVPITLGIIALLLYFNFLNVVEVGIVMLSLPFALVGGVWLMWLLDYNLSVAVAVGFIGLGGLAAQTGVVMLLYLDQAWKKTAAGGTVSVERLIAAINDGAVARVRPILMTVVAIVAGLLPLMWARGTGASVIQRIAAPMIGGMITSTVLTLVVIPVLYYLWRRTEVGPSS